MAVLRENILQSNVAKDKFLQGVVALSQEMPGITAQDAFNFLQTNSIPLPMQGINQPLSTYDLYVLWHVVAMSLPMPPGNAAHSGPVFLPWHRMFMIRLEQDLQRVLNDADFGLPYWDWATDGELPASNQWQTTLWSEPYLGEARGDVESGILGDMRVRLYQYIGSPQPNLSPGTLLSINPRPILRESGLDSTVSTLPDKADIQSALNEDEYDVPPWSQNVVSHRNRLEGWINGPQLHNRIHVWIGGDMSPGTSPNDPAFFLNHCNVDRIWEAWMASEGLEYRPDIGEGTVGHRIDDLMIAILGDALRPSEVLDPSDWYSYDSLSVV